MTITYDENGIVIQNLSEILDELEALAQQFLGSDFVITPESPMGNLLLAFADRELSIQELAQYVATQLNVDTAEGKWLDFICALSNIYRKAPTYTTIPITVTGIDTTIVNAGQLMIVDNTTNRYYINTEYFVLDGTTIDVTFRCTDYGQVSASSASVYAIKTPLSGITSVAYKSGGTTVVGSETETDNELRLRRENELEINASSTTASIRAAVLEVTNVEFCKVYENDTSGTVDGIPTKAFEVIVQGGDDDEIALAILTKKTAGIQAYGSTTVTVVDNDGDSKVIGLTRPVEVPMEYDITILVTDGQTGDWEATVKEALVTHFNSYYTVGQTIYSYPAYKTLNNYEEILNVEEFFIGKVATTADPSATEIAIAKREVGTLSVANITITQTTT